MNLHKEMAGEVTALKRIGRHPEAAGKSVWCQAKRHTGTYKQDYLMCLSGYNFSTLVGTDKAWTEITSSFRKGLRQFSLQKMVNSPPHPSSLQVYIKKTVAKRKGTISHLCARWTGQVAISLDGKIIVRDEENLHNQTGNSPTPPQITWFVPSFAQAYDTSTMHLEKTCKDKNNQTIFWVPKL